MITPRLKYPYALIARVDGDWIVVSRHRASSDRRKGAMYKYLHIARKRHPELGEARLVTVLEEVEQYSVIKSHQWTDVRSVIISKG